MTCPSCGGGNVFHSRPRSMREGLLKAALPITFYRCHDCNWRRAKLRGRGAKSMAMYILSIIGYAGGAALVIAVIAGILLITLTFLGIPLPW